MREAPERLELLIEDLRVTVPDNALVVIVRLKECSSLLQSAQTTALSGPYVETKLVPSEDIVGDQLQRSSFKPDTYNPRWEPAERFQFVISDEKELKNIKIRFSVYCFRPTSDPNPLGDVSYPLTSLNVSSAAAESVKLKLTHPVTGKAEGEIEFDIVCSTVQRAKSVREQAIFEYQRWVPTASPQWGSTRPGHFLPNDRRWGKCGAGADGASFSDSMEDVSPFIPDKWTISKQWATESTSTDAEGWQYSDNFNSQTWFPKANKMVVRRRVWTREIISPFQPRDGPSAAGGNDDTILNPIAGGDVRRKRVT